MASFLAAAAPLLAVESVSDRPDELRKAVELVLDFVGPGFTVERFESGGTPSALVYRGAARPAFGVILNAHLDVVPAPAAQFLPYREGDRLYARGAQDMKVAALAQALAFRELAGRVPYPLGLQLVTDEEAGDPEGTLCQLRAGVTARFAVIGEATGLGIATECKGIVRVTLRAEGRSAHGAYPWLGDNAVLKLNRTLDAILAAYPVPDTDAWRATVSVARVHTPNQAMNQVPAQAAAWLDIRFPAGDPGFDARTPQQVAAYLAGFCEPGVTPVVDRIDPPYRADERGPEVAALRAAARGQGYSGEILRRHGTGDVCFFAEHGIEAVEFGIGGDGLHGPAEYADITTIAPYHLALTEFLLAPYLSSTVIDSGGNVTD
jgi:succinyl-diaminopimelate desuccinylase